MSWIRNFIHTVFLSLNPKQYTKLTHLSIKSSLGYFFTLVFATFFIMSLLWIPHLFTLPDTLSEEFSKFNDLSVEIVYDQREPVVLTEDYPIATIDMQNEYDSIEDGLVLITKDATYYRFLPYGSGSKISDTENMLENSEEMGKFIAVIAFMAVPMVMAYAYVYFVIKYIVVALLIGLLGFIIVRVVRFDITFSDVLRASMFASTPMVLLGLLTKPFIPNLSYLEYIVFIIYFILGCLVLGEFEAPPTTESRTKKINLEGDDDDR